MTEFRVNGNPIAQPRPRRSGSGGVYTPTKNGIKGWRKLIILEACLNIKQTITKPVDLELMFFMPRPKSHFGTGKNAHKLKASSPLAHSQKPDLDNLVKAVMDALTTAKVWMDDSQVIALSSSKWWANSKGPGVKISISEA